MSKCKLIITLVSFFHRACNTPILLFLYMGYFHTFKLFLDVMVTEAIMGSM